MPFIPTAGEMKTKPTQHSVKELREIGIQPDVVLCRADRPVPEGDRRKIALFTNVDAGGGHPGARRRFDLQDSRRRCTPKASTSSSARSSRSTRRRPTSSTWNELVDALEHPEHAVNIAMVGKYVDLTESYKSLSEALIARRHPHALARCRSTTSTPRRSSATASTRCTDMDAILVPGGFGKRGVEGKIAAIRYARENGIPYLGICLGMQLAVIEYARHEAGLADANSTEFDPATPHPVVALITEWQNRDGSIEKRSASSDLGGTMRLGAQPCDVVPGSLAHRIYGATTVAERHRHRYEVNNHYLPRIEAAGLVVGAWAKSETAGDLCEMIELPQHPWFFGCQFHPEFTSNPRRGHPLFVSFVRAALERRKQRASSVPGVATRLVVPA